MGNMYSQVGMPTNNPNKDAVLDLNRTDGTSAKGLLLPKVELTALNSALPMTANVAGMHVWNTATTTGINAVTPGEYYNDGAKWVRVASPIDAWLQDGNTNGALKTIGTKDNFDLPFITNNTEKMRLTSGGRLGIGTDTPLVGFHLKSSDPNNNDLMIEGVDDGATFIIKRSTTSSLPTGQALGGLIWTDVDPTPGVAALTRINSYFRGPDLSSLSFFVSRSTLAQMTLNQKGYLGLGTTSPGSKFHLYNENISDSDDDFRIETRSDTYTPGVFIDRNRTGGANLMNNDPLGLVVFRSNLGGASSASQLVYLKGTYKGDGTTNLSSLALGTSNTDRMVINENGNVGIGTSAPAQKLDVNGSIKSTTALIVSDARYKTNIETLQKPLEIVNRLRGTSYEMNTKQFPDKGFAEGKQYGVIAQEVEKILPDLVTTGSDGYKAVNYQGFIPVLIEAVKTQQTEIENQKKQLTAKDSEIKELKARMDKLEKAVNGLLK
ncbi:Chaperone of endosialidase [Flavobacterium phragmitis]|uniref:Chaperone of endosialidase n=2 Tax=Flavobacterium phragmitis TaxID=739143 RepID=A0A1I1RXQ0_9FLAO|nr:Chaperone of endosialidase [Flavobacterium phragmitis]